MFSDNLCTNCFGQMPRGGAYCPHCGYDASAPDNSVQFALAPFTMLNNRYMLGRVLGAGGFGITYIAYDIATNMRVAVKEYFPGAICVRMPDMRVAPQRMEEAYEAGKQKFYNEANLLNSLHDCPCVVRVNDFFFANNTAYIVMEFVPGNSLKKELANHGGSIHFEQARNMIVEIAMSLAQVHNLNVLHRDISPDNIMVCPDGHVKLIDFGASRDYVNNRSGGLSVILKPGFAPPEQYSRTKPQGPYTDVYALACTFYRAVTGVNVPEANDRLGGKEMSSMADLCPYVPQSVSDAVKKALELNYKNRTPDMATFIMDISSTTPPSENRGAGGVSAPQPPQPVHGCKVDICYGNSIIASYLLTDGTELVIGRNSQTCNVVVKNDMRVSRTHCRIRYNASAGSVTVTDVSSYGTFWMDGGVYLQKNVPSELRGSSIMLQLSSSDIFVRIEQ